VAAAAVVAVVQGHRSVLVDLEGLVMVLVRRRMGMPGVMEQHLLAVVAAMVGLALELLAAMVAMEVALD
jgi:hypothetical protein